jgi:hypothetical protein
VRSHQLTARNRTGAGPGDETASENYNSRKVYSVRFEGDVVMT